MLGNGRQHVRRGHWDSDIGGTAGAEEKDSKEEYLYSAVLVRTHTLKALRHESRSFTEDNSDITL